jgi:hypothetical protein
MNGHKVEDSRRHYCGLGLPDSINQALHTHEGGPATLNTLGTRAVAWKRDNVRHVRGTERPSKAANKALELKAPPPVQRLPTNACCHPQTPRGATIHERTRMRWLDLYTSHFNLGVVAGPAPPTQRGPHPWDHARTKPLQTQKKGATSERQCCFVQPEHQRPPGSCRD